MLIEGILFEIQQFVGFPHSGFKYDKRMKSVFCNDTKFIQNIDVKDPRLDFVTQNIWILHTQVHKERNYTKNATIMPEARFKEIRTDVSYCKLTSMTIPHL